MPFIINGRPVEHDAEGYMGIAFVLQPHLDERTHVDFMMRELVKRVPKMEFFFSEVTTPQLMKFMFDHLDDRRDPISEEDTLVTYAYWVAS